MMKLLVLFAFVAVAAAQAQAPRVKVDIYYSALCPDTTNFIANQLGPLYNEFRNNLAIKYVPFGKANSTRSASDDISFTCQRLEPECFGNRIQGCVLSRLRNQDDQVRYVQCQMSVNADIGHQPCVVAAGLVWNDILACESSDFAVQQQLSFEQISAPIIEEFDWVPTVVYNGKVNVRSHTGTAPPLRQIICDLINDAHPGCGTRF